LKGRLKELLLEIELSLRKEEWERALSLYEKINQEWEELSSGLTQEEAEEALRLTNFIEDLLKNKSGSLQVEDRYLKTRQSYTKFT
jgi:predicted nuclease with TOPRIM domain